MKTSRLIKQLQSELDLHGDCDVRLSLWATHEVDLVDANQKFDLANVNSSKNLEVKFLDGEICIVSDAELPNPQD